MGLKADSVFSLAYPMKLYPVTVFPGLGGMYLGFRGLPKAPNAGKCVLKDGDFCLKLGLIGQMLEGAAPANPVKRAGRADPFGGGFDDLHQFPLGPTGVFTGNTGPYQIPRRGKADKDPLPP
jgi:hypothetical protein